MNNFNVNPKYNAQIQVFAQALRIPEDQVRAAILRSCSQNAPENGCAIQEVFTKAARGEEITVAAIGGSITEGASAKSNGDQGNNARQYTEALDGESCWFDRTVNWFKETFPQATVNAINAGIGATPSFLGTFRLEQMVLRHRPDIVMVEFSVNDPSAFGNLLENEIFDAYESILRRCLEAGIAVIAVFLNDQDNNGLQHVHSQIAQYYHVPTVSYHNAISPNGQLICDWALLSPDEIHPNNVGHALLATCICNYFDHIAGNPIMKTIPALPQKWLYHDTFHKVFARYAYEFPACNYEGFVYQETAPNCKKWKGALVADTCSGTLRLTVPKGAKRVWVQYFNCTGSFETDLGGRKTLCNTAPTGWPKAMWHRIHTGEPLSENTELTLTTGRTGQVIFLGLLASF